MLEAVVPGVHGEPRAGVAAGDLVPGILEDLADAGGGGAQAREVPPVLHAAVGGIRDDLGSLLPAPETPNMRPGVAWTCELNRKHAPLRRARAGEISS